MDAAVAAGAPRLVAQSFAFASAPGPKPWRESDPLNIAVAGDAGVTPRAAASLERQVLAAPLDGLVLRYGLFYGPGTGFDAPMGPGSIHVGDAPRAHARGARHLQHRRG